MTASDAGAGDVPHVVGGGGAGEAVRTPGFSVTTFGPPSGYPRVRHVADFHDLLTTPFEDGINALCWQRALTGDFGEVMGKLKLTEGITSLDENLLLKLPLSAEGRLAAEFMRDDLRRLRARGCQPELNGIVGHLRDEDPGALRTDVYSFHADRATDEADTWLCTYLGPSSEGLRNDEARRHVDIHETRARLLKEYGGSDDEGFREYLADHCYDLHYLPAPAARPYSFGLGNLWRIAVEYPGCPVPPCIHRAPDSLPGDPPRLLLIA